MNPNPNAGYLVASQGKQFGPYSLEQIRQYVTEGRLISADLAWTEGMSSWEPLNTLLGLPAAEQATPPLWMGAGGGPPAFGTPSPALFAKPPNYMVPAVLATVFCCMPFGIVSIVYASQVDSKYMVGDQAGAIAASKNAKLWFLLAVFSIFALGFLGAIGSFLGMFQN